MTNDGPIKWGAYCRKGKPAFLAALSYTRQRILLAITYILPPESNHFAFTTWSKQHFAELVLTKLRGSRLNNYVICKHLKTWFCWICFINTKGLKPHQLYHPSWHYKSGHRVTTQGQHSQGGHINLGREQLQQWQHFRWLTQIESQRPARSALWPRLGCLWGHAGCWGCGLSMAAGLVSSSVPLVLSVLLLLLCACYV